MSGKSSTSFWGRAKSFLPSQVTALRLLAGSAFLISIVQAYAEMSDSEKEELKAQLGDSFELCTNTIAKHVTYCMVKGMHPGMAQFNPGADYDCSLSISEIFDKHGLTGTATREACKLAVTPTGPVEYRAQVSVRPGV